MIKMLVQSPSSRPGEGLRLIRIVIALVLIVHPIHRIYNGNVANFGEYLDSIGYPFGVGVAWLISITQLASSVALLVGRLIVPACVADIGILFVGIVLVHWPEGWFVVGGGTNGMEFSVMLIISLAGIAWAHWPRETNASI